MLHHIASLRESNPNFDFVVNGDAMVVSVYYGDTFLRYILIG